MDLLAFQCLYDSFEQEAGYFQFATAITSNDIEEIQKFLDTAVEERYSHFCFWFFWWTGDFKTYKMYNLDHVNILMPHLDLLC